MSSTASSCVIGNPFQAQTTPPRRRLPVKTEALFKRKQKEEPVVEEKPQKKSGIFGKKQTGARSKREAELLAELEQPRKKQGFLSGVTQALDFSAARSKEDEELLYQAKNAKGRLTDEQAQALRRKIGGTKKDFWKDWVDVKGEYTDKGYVDQAEGITGLPFLIAVVLGVFGALAYVVSQTAAPPTPPVG